jgi:methyl-accepting chemotaxis protein
MSLVRKSRSSEDSSAALHAVSGVVSKNVARDADAQRKRARTLAKQQQAAERVAAATSQLSAGINEASSAAEELRRATEQIATGAEEAAGAAQQSLAAITQVSGAITRQMASVNTAKEMAAGMQLLSMPRSRPQSTT